MREFSTSMTSIIHDLNIMQRACIFGYSYVQIPVKRQRRVKVIKDCGDFCWFLISEASFRPLCVLSAVLQSPWILSIIGSIFKEAIFFRMSGSVSVENHSLECWRLFVDYSKIPECAVSKGF
jgi:hypothetical protein